MPKKSKPSTEGAPATPRKKAAAKPSERQENRPPASAENFEHVLRRLISGRSQPPRAS